MTAVTLTARVPADIVGVTPPAPTAPRVRAHRRAIELERDALRTGAADLAWKSATGDLAAREALRAIPAKLAGLQFEIDLNHEAQEVAQKQDAAAEVAWRASIQTLPVQEIIAGLNKDECCHRCQPGINGGCVLAGGAPYAGANCWHPTRFGSFDQFSVDDGGRKIFPHRDNPQAAKVFNAALDLLKVRGKFA